LRNIYNPKLFGLGKVIQKVARLIVGMVMGGIVVVTIAMLATHLSSLNKANLAIVVVMRNK